MASKVGEAGKAGPAGKVDQVLRAGAVVEVGDHVVPGARGEAEDVVATMGLRISLGGIAEQHVVALSPVDQVVAGTGACSEREAVTEQRIVTAAPPAGRPRAEANPPATPAPAPGRPNAGSLPPRAAWFGR